MNISRTSLLDKLWYSGELSYKLHEGQKTIYKTMRNSTENTTVILSARRFGKSFFAAIYALEEAIKNPESKVILLAPDKHQAFEIYNPILKEISRDAPEGVIRPTKSEHKWHIYKSELIFAGFDTIAESLRGRGAILIIIDESGFVNADQYEYVTKSILSPMLQKTIGKKKGKVVYISTPAKTPDHPFNILWESFQKQGKLHKYTIYDNPILTKEDIDEIAAECGGYDSVAFRREYLCENVRDLGGLVIPKFDKHHILNAEGNNPHQSVCWIVGDLGGIRDKTVLLVFSRLSQNGKLVVIAESIFSPNVEIIEIGKGIIELQKKYAIQNYHIWIDAHGQSLVDLQQMCNITATLPPKQDRDGAISALNAAFFNDELFILSDCQLLVKSLFNCMFNEKRTDFLRTIEYGHADALMAAVYGYRVAKFVEPAKKNLGFGVGGQFTIKDSLTKLESITKAIHPKNFWR